MAQMHSDEELLDIIRECGNDTLVVYTPSGGSASSVYMILDDVTEKFDKGDGTAFIGRRIEAEARTVDLVAPVRGATIVYDGTTYVIREVLPDKKEGMTEFAMETV